MTSAKLTGAVVALCAVTFLAFVGVALTELDYASDHPFRYGPAKVIATAAGAGALLSLAVGLLAVAVGRADGRD